MNNETDFLVNQKLFKILVNRLLQELENLKTKTYISNPTFLRINEKVLDLKNYLKNED
jgi:translation elongation factor EF-Ts